MEKEKICQSCGMPLLKDPKGGGTNNDNSNTDKYCSYCFIEGKFIDSCSTIEEKINKNVRIAVDFLGMPEEKAREMANAVLPNLDRWKL